MAAPTSSFLEKLRPEIRLRIYGYVFGSNRVIKPAGSDTALGMRIDTTDCVKYSFPPPEPDTFLDISILLSNKLIFTEALPVLYDEKIIRGSTDNFEELLQQPDFVERARHIEVADCIGHYQDKNFHSVLRRLQVLPQVRSFVILSDCLGLVDQKIAGPDKYLTVPQFCGVAQLGEVTCIDIGIYQVHGLFGKFHIVNRRLKEMWPGVQSCVGDYDAYRELESVLHRWPMSSSTFNGTHNIIAWASQTSLRCWVGLHDLLISTTMSGELDRLRDSKSPSEAEQFLRLKQYSQTTRFYGSFDTQQLINGITERSVVGRWRLRDSRGGNDPELLSWATEYLSANIHSYDAPPTFPIRQGWTHRKSHWAETDGSLSTLEYHHKHRKHVASGLINPLYFSHPTLPRVVHDRESLSYYIGHHPIPLQGILKGDWRLNFPDLSDLELKQVADLGMALDRDSFDPAHGECEVLNFERWSCDLLRRYMLSSGSFPQTELNHATVNDLSTVVKRVLTVLASTEERLRCGLTLAEITTYTQPPTDLDDDVFLGLAWRYSPLLARAWREYVATANPSSMDLN
jgi:hypothetical protein